MSRIAVLLLLLTAGPAIHLPYQRSLAFTGTGPFCAVLDPLIFAHAAPSLTDLRLLSPTGAEVPFVITVSGPAETTSGTIPVRDLVRTGSTLSFALDPPPRPYTDVILDIAATDFVAVATITDPATHRFLGQFPLFDLSAQHLPRSTTLRLAESSLPRLHVDLRSAPGSRVLTVADLRGATVPPSREAQTLFTPAVTTTDFTEQGSTTIAHLTLPAHIPVERLRFTLLPSSLHGFSRPVHLNATSSSTAGEAESVTGQISRLNLTVHGVHLDETHLTVPAILGANLQRAADVEVTIDNGIDAPLPLRSVALESRERRLCFLAPSDVGPLTLFYGDPHPTRAVPPYDAAPILAAQPMLATLGPEQRNPSYIARSDRPSVTRRHPRLFTLGSVLSVCLVAVLALRSRKLRL